ncbi:MAG: sensor domain-containing diguanylate cyclase [Eubacteriales bacterium]
MMDEKIYKILRKGLEHSSQAVLFFDIKERTPFLSNKQAISYFANHEGEIDVYNIFEDQATTFLRSTVTEHLGKNNFAMVYDVSLLTNKGTSAVCDVQVVYADEERSVIMLELFMKQDNRMEIAYSQVNQSTRAEAILNYDEKLSIVHCNDLFYEVFEANEEIRHALYGNDLSNGFQPEIREELLKEIHDTLKVSSNFHTKMKVITSKGDTFWYSLELLRRTLDNSGTDKIMAYMTNIERQVEIEADYSFLNKFFSAFQELTNDVMCRIDVAEVSLMHLVKSELSELVGQTIPDYVNTFVTANIVHPEDAEKFVNYSKLWLTGEVETFTVRTAFDSTNYVWTELSGQKIYDKEGKLIEILARAKDVENEQNLKKNNSALNQYFTALQDLSDDMLYRVDLTTKTLYRTSQQAEIFGINPIMTNYPQSILESGIIHQEDEKNYLKYGEKVLQGIPCQVEVRMKSSMGKYEFRRLTCSPVYGENDEVIEMFGKIVNIQMVRELEEQANFDALTHVLNKRAMLEFTSNILKESTLTSKHALFFMDLDNFKGANDTLGHLFGDFLLGELGQRLKDSIRQDDLVGRVGGDEFVIFLRDVPNLDIMMGKAKMLLSTISEDFVDGKLRHSIHGSLGVAVFPDHGTSYEELYHHADIALYNSKNQGKNMVTIFSEDLERKK